MPDCLVDVSRVSVIRQQAEILHQISFRIGRGECVGITGASGAGKSTLLNVLSGNVQPDYGAVRMSANNTTANHPQPNRVLRIPQHPYSALNPAISIARHFSCLPKPQQPAATSIESCLLQAGIDSPNTVLTALPGQLSGGECQRIVWAMAFYRKPQLLLLDEATSALDEALQFNLFERLKIWCKQHQAAVVFVSHSIPLLKRFAQPILILHQGQLVDQFSPHSMDLSVLSPFAQQIFSDYV